MRGDEREYDMGAEVASLLHVAEPTLAPPPAPPESEVVTVNPPAPLGCFLVDVNWIRRSKADGFATVGMFHGEDAAANAMIAQAIVRFGDKEVRRLARAGHLMVRVKEVPAAFLSDALTQLAKPADGTAA